MASAAADLIHVDPDHAREQAAVDALRGKSTIGIVAIGQVEKAVQRVKKHPTAVVPKTLVLLIDDVFTAEGGLEAAVQHEAGKAVAGGEIDGWTVSFITHERAIVSRAAGNSAAPVVGNKHLLVHREIGMQGDAEQAGIVPALALAGQVQYEGLRGRGGVVFENPDFPFAFPDDKFGCPGDGRESQRVEKRQIREGRHR